MAINKECYELYDKIKKTEDDWYKFWKPRYPKTSLCEFGEKLYLKPENKDYKEIEINEENELIIWGIVTYVVKKFN